MRQVSFLGLLLAVLFSPVRARAGAADGQLLVCYNFGHPWRTLPLAAAKGNTPLALTGLPAGVYSYTLVVDGAAVATRRLVVTRYPVR